VGRHFAASLIQAQARGVSTRQVLRDVWQEAASRARADVAAQEAVDASRRAKRRAAMAERLDAQVSMRHRHSDINNNNGSKGGGAGLGLGGFGAPVIDPMDTFAPVLVAEPVLPPPSSSSSSSSSSSLSSQTSMNKQHHHHRDLGSRSLVLGLPDLVADAAWSLGRQNRLFTLTATLVEDYTSPMAAPGDESAVADGATSEVDSGSGDQNINLTAPPPPPIASDGSHVAGLIEVAISDAPIKLSKAAKMAQTSAERHAAAALEVDRVYGAAPGSDVYGVRRSGSTVILSGLRPDAVYRVRFARPSQEQQPWSLSGASGSQTVKKGAENLSSVGEEDETLADSGAGKEMSTESNHGLAALALAAENPEWVEGEPPTVEVRTQPCPPDPPPNLAIAVAQVSLSGAPPQKSNSKASAPLQASKTRSRLNGSSCSSGDDGLQPVCHLTWSAPIDNGWPIDEYRVQRRLRCTVALPAPDRGVVHNDNNSTDGDQRGGNSAKSVGVVVLQQLEGHWATVHEGSSLGWSDLLPSHADSASKKSATSSSGSAKGNVSESKGSGAKTKSSLSSSTPSGASASALLSEQIAELNQLSSAQAEQHAPHFTHVAEVVHTAMDDDTATASTAVSAVVEPGVTTEACYRVAARNHLGWGAYSASVRGRLRGGLAGVQVTVADGDEWAAALEGNGAHILRSGASSSKDASRLGPSLTTLPHQLTEGIFHNFSAAASASVDTSASSSSSSTRKDRGFSTIPVARAVSQAPDRGLSRRAGRGALGSSPSNPSAHQGGGLAGRGSGSNSGARVDPGGGPPRAVTLGRVQAEDKRRLPAAAHLRRSSAASIANGGLKRRPPFDEPSLTNAVFPRKQLPEQALLGESERYRKSLALLGVRQTAADVPMSIENNSGDALGLDGQEKLDLNELGAGDDNKMEVLE